MHKFILIIISFSFFSCINTSQNNINDSSIIHKSNTTEKSSESNFENHKKDDFFDESSSEKTNDSDEIINDEYFSRLNKIKLSKSINTKQNEYHPVPNSDGSIIYFVGMDRTGQFSTKIDFTQTRNYGGEDIWFSEREFGLYTEAKPLFSLNDNTHQSVTSILEDEILIYGIYEESYKVDGSGTDAGFYNGDIFKFNLITEKFIHLGQPINSIFFESDAFITSDGKHILFVSDKNTLGPYKQKGWKHNDSFWGNTDIFVSEKIDDYWSEPINLGIEINTDFAERTPFLSLDKKTLYFSSNGHNGYGEQDVFVSKRINDSWTSWTSPKNLGAKINGPYNDWGFKLYDNESKAMMSSETKLPYKVNTQLLGDGGIREHNLRNGYKVEGKASASFNYQCRSDIYYVDIKNEKLTVTIDDMLFNFNKYDIKKSNIKLLDRLAELINDNKDYNIKILGHTDNSGDDIYNLNLSEKRSKAIYDEMIKRGVDSERMIFKGLGESQPIYNNNSEENRSKNRRVEIIFE